LQPVSVAGKGLYWGFDMEEAQSKEFDKRIRKFQIILQDNEMIGAFVTQEVNICYFTGTTRGAFLFVPREGNPILFSDKSKAGARNEDAAPKTVLIRDKDEIPSVLRHHKNIDMCSIGLEMATMPARDYLWFRESFPESKWTNISKMLLKLRSLKSPYEIKQIKKAAALLHQGFQNITGIIREDMTETDLERHLDRLAQVNLRLRLRSCVCKDRSNPYHLLHNGRVKQPRRIKKNEPIVIEYCMRTGGYTAIQSRTYVIGELSPILKEAHDCAVEILHVLSKERKVGVPCNYLYKKAKQKAKERGYGEFFMGYGKEAPLFIGHGIGMELNEYPLIASDSLSEVQERMVIALEPKFIFPDMGMVGLEDIYLVAASGLQRLTITKQALLNIS
jgi:Xaa-Pro dipeptidase